MQPSESKILRRVAVIWRMTTHSSLRKNSTFCGKTSKDRKKHKIAALGLVAVLWASSLLVFHFSEDVPFHDGRLHGKRPDRKGKSERPATREQPLNLENLLSPVLRRQAVTPENFRELNDRRQARLRNKCQGFRNFRTRCLPPHHEQVDVPGVFRACVPPEVDLSTWEFFASLFPADSSHPITVVSTRHPFHRLVLVYRDIFLNGNPISKYKDGAVSQGLGDKGFLWLAYWLPALVSRGDVEPSAWMAERHRMLKQESDPCNLTLKLKRELALQVERDYKNKQIELGRFENVSFTFQDFLQHVLWSSRYGVMDHAWAPQTCLCNPCRNSYDYILESENIVAEAKQVFRAMGIPQDVLIEDVFSNTDFDPSSVALYFDDVTSETLKRLFHLYWNDFHLYGYV